jgi:hypothetical protein
MPVDIDRRTVELLRFSFTEGPAVTPGQLYFTDVFRQDPSLNEQGKAEVFVEQALAPMG